MDQLENKKTIDIPSSEELKAELDSYKRRHNSNRQFFGAVGVVLVIAAVAVLITILWMPVLSIYGSSMNPLLAEGDIVLSVKGKNFETGDIVAFYYGNKLLVKRVIGGAGDWVSVENDGTVLVNGEHLNEPYLQEKAYGHCDIEFPYQVPEGKWFVMGDNRAESIDSRSNQIGCVTQEQMVGKIFFRVWPLNKIGIVTDS